MTTDPVFGAFTKFDSTTLVATYGLASQDGTAGHGLAKSFVTVFAASHAAFANTADTQPVAAILSASGVGALVLGPGGSTGTNVALTWTATGAAAFTGTITMTAPLLLNITQFWDGTASDGKVTAGVSNPGTPLGTVSIYKNSTDTQAVAQLLNTNGVGSLGLGPGGSTGVDITITRTGAAAATVSGTLTIPAPVITGHPVIEGVTPTGATGTGNLAFSASPTFTGTVTAAASSFSGHMTIEGVTSTGATGTGKFAFDASPTLTGTPVVSGTKLRVIDGTAAHGAVETSAGNIGINIAGVNVFGTDGDANPQVNMISAGGVGAINFGAGGATGTTVGLSFSGTNALAVGAPGGATFSGKVVSSLATGGVGYSTGAGGTVTQGSGSGKGTAFTLSKVCGTITFNNAALASDTSVASVWTNTAIAATDTVVFNHISGGTLGAYNLACTPAAGSATLNLRNVHSGSLSEAPVFAFSVMKAVTS